MKNYLKFNSNYIWVESNQDFITRVHICNNINEINENLNLIRKSFSHSHTKQALAQLELYFLGKLEKFDLPILIEGSTFQKLIWLKLLDIPYGEKLTYGQLASKVGGPNYARSIGGACNANNLPILIPCHRIVAKDGIGGFAFGLSLKQQLLKLESNLLI